MGSPLVPLTLFGWIPFVLLLFLFLPPRRAVITAFLIAWLFLPMAGFKIPGLPDYTKMSATCVGVLIAALLLSRLIGFSPIGEAIHASVVAGTPQADSNGLDFPSPR